MMFCFQRPNGNMPIVVSPTTIIDHSPISALIKFDMDTLPSSRLKCKNNFKFNTTLLQDSDTLDDMKMAT